MQNVRSLNNKLSLLRSNIALLSKLPHILVFTETWLKSTTDSRSIGLFDYNIYRSDRNTADGHLTRGGGVLVAVHHSLASRELVIPQLPIATRQTQDDLDALFIEVSYSTSKLLLAATYIPNHQDMNFYKDF